MKRRKKTQEMNDRWSAINQQRIKNGFDPIIFDSDYIRGEWDEGHCMSTGCTCTTEDAPKCGLFRRFDDSRIKKDFIWHALGWETSSSDDGGQEYIE